MILLWCAVAMAGGLAAAQTATNSVLYRLDTASSFQEGCFPPCECPSLVPVPVKGTFLLTPTGFNGLFNNYAVTQVNWVISLGSTGTTVTGSGSYKVGGEVALEQELSLDLQLGAGAVEHFDSGLVPELVLFPDIQATISLHGMVCFDQVFCLKASPACGEPVPGIASLSRVGNNLVITATNGLGGRAYTVLASTNLTLGVSQWTPVATNTLSADGPFSITASNAVDLGAAQKFYLLRMQ